MDKIEELIDAVERRTLSIDRERAEEEALAAEIQAVVAALRRLVTVCQGAGWLRHPGDAIEEAETALTAFDGFPADDESDSIGPDGRLSPQGDE